MQRQFHLMVHHLQGSYITRVHSEPHTNTTHPPSHVLYVAERLREVLVGRRDGVHTTVTNNSCMVDTSGRTKCAGCVVRGKEAVMLTVTSLRLGPPPDSTRTYTRVNSIASLSLVLRHTVNILP